MNVTLYHYWRSSCSWRVRWALALKNIAYKSVAINLLKGEQNDPKFLLKNPRGLVPALEMDGKVLFESMAILEFLEEAFPQGASLLPQDSESRFYVRQLSQMVVAGIQPTQNLSLLNYYSSDKAKKAANAKYWIDTGMAAFEKVLQSGPYGSFCYQGMVTIADLCLVPQVYNALRFAVDMNRYPISYAIYRRCLSTQACIDASPEKQPDAVP